MKKEDKMILKNRAKSTAMSIIEMLEGCSVENLVNEGFVCAEGEIEREIIKRFETVLVKTCIDSQYIKENAYAFLKETAQWIKKEKIQREFLDFGYFLNNQLRMKHVSIEVLSSYINLYLEVLAHLATVGKMIYGLRTNGSFVIKNEIYPPLDLDLEEALRRGDLEFFLRKLRKLGYDIKTEYDLQVFIHNEQVISNMVSVMASFIDENTEDLIPIKFYEPSDGFYPFPMGISTETIKESLSRRRYVLPRDGVYVDIYNIRDISGLLIKEILKNDQIYMLFRMDFDSEGSFYGVYDTKYATFYSIFTGSSADPTHGKIVENLVLEIYAHLVTDLHQDDPGHLQVFKDKIEAIGSDEMGIAMSFHDSSAPSTIGTNSRPFDKRKYKEEDVSINPFIRRLPAGSVASEDAIKSALEFGYELQPGETFVRPFTRKSYKNRDDLE